MNHLILYIFFIIPFSIPLCAQIPTGAIATYKLDNTASDNSANRYNGSFASTSATSNRFSNANSATSFIAGSSVGILPFELATAVKDDFSVGFWFKTTMNAPFSSQWYGGRALVDAEVCGGTFDWGTSLIDGGKVCVGIGNPDITIKSTQSGYNDGNWHFATVTRNKTSGILSLFMEGVQVATTSGTTTGSLTAPNSIRLGSNPCNTNPVYTGDFDDMIFYDRVLSNTEVANLYTRLSAVILPLRWISFTGTIQGNRAKFLWQVEAVQNNDYFEVEYSTNGSQFSKKVAIPDKDAISTTAGKSSYSFVDGPLGTGSHFYRVRQVDRDGRFTFSKIIKLDVDKRTSDLYLQHPAADELLLVNVNHLEVLQLQFADASGRVLHNQKMRSTDAVIRTNVSKLLPGYYLLRVRTANGLITIPWIKK